MASFLGNLTRALNAFGGMRPVTARVAKDRLSVMLTNQRVNQFDINDRESMLRNVSDLLKENNIKICESKNPYLTFEKDEIGLHFPIEPRRVS